MTFPSVYTKQYYSIGEVSQMLELPIHTLRFWESEFPMFKPHRTPKGTRRFTPADIDMARTIKSVLYDKGMKIEGAVEFLNRTYRKYPPRRTRTCSGVDEAMAMLDEVAETLSDPHAVSKLSAVMEWIGRSMPAPQRES